MLKQNEGATLCRQRELLTVTAPGLLRAGEQYFSKNESLDFITPLKPSLATDSNDSDRCDNDSGKELKTIKLYNQKEKFTQPKSGRAPLARHSNPAATPLHRDLIPRSELRTVRRVATLRQDGEKVLLCLKKHKNPYIWYLRV